MQKKGWGFPLIIFAISTALLFYYTSTQTYSSMAQTIVNQNINNGLPTEITAVKFSHYNESINIKLKSDEWIITSHSNTIADTSYIYNTLSSFINPANLEFVLDYPDLEEYGISQTSKKITLYDKDDKEFTLTRGKSASNSHYYV